MAAAAMAALSAAACNAPPRLHPAPSPTAAPTRPGTPLVVQHFASGTPLVLPDGACDVASLRLTVTLAAGTVRQGGAILPTATLRNVGTRTCDAAPECPQNARISSDTAGRGGAEIGIDCFQRPGYAVLAPGQEVTQKAGSFPALEDPGDYSVSVSWGAMENAARLTITP